MREPLKRVLSVPFAALILIYDAIEAVFGPIVRPVTAALGRLRLFQRMGEAIADMPAYCVLALLAVPFAAIEPFKFISLYWLAEGQFVLGGVALVTAHLSSLLICERIFHAGKAKLLTIGWFARGYGIIVRLRDGALAWLKTTAAWRAATSAVSRARSGVRALLRA